MFKLSYVNFIDGGKIRKKTEALCQNDKCQRALGIFKLSGKPHKFGFPVYQQTITSEEVWELSKKNSTVWCIKVSQQCVLHTLVTESRYIHLPPEYGWKYFVTQSKGPILEKHIRLEGIW